MSCAELGNYADLANDVHKMHLRCSLFLLADTKLVKGAILHFTMSQKREIRAIPTGRGVTLVPIVCIKATASVRYQ